MNCTSLSFIQNSNCADDKKNLKAIAEISSSPTEIKTYADTACEDPDMAASTYETMMEKVKDANGNSDFTKNKYGFGFKKNGNKCQRLCGPGEYLGQPRAPEVDHKAMWSQQFNFDYREMAQNNSYMDQASMQNEMRNRPLSASEIPTCQKCPAGTVTDENTNRCLKNKTDRCGVTEELVEQPNFGGGYYGFGGGLSDGSAPEPVKTKVISCWPKCQAGWERSKEMSMCQQTAQTMKAERAQLLKTMEAWDPEAEMRDQYFGACTAADLVQVAKDYKEEQLDTISNYATRNSPYGMMASQSFGQFFMSNMPKKCQLSGVNMKTGEYFKKKIDPNAVSDAFWKKLSGPFPPMESPQMMGFGGGLGGIGIGGGMSGYYPGGGR